jgi:hypothetical protein
VRRLLPVLLLAACSSGPVPPAWQASARYSLDAFQQSYLRGDTRVADLEFARARAELASTGSPALVARAELVRCATRAASLEFDGCPAFEKLRADAGAEELAYAEFLGGRAARAPGEEVLSRLVALGVRFGANQSSPTEIASAIEISSMQGWRRPLLAWLGVAAQRAEAAGDREALDQIRRRIAVLR